MSQEEYDKESKRIWQTYVPKSGQSETMQGELIRAVERLRNEAQRNGNINFSTNCHIRILNFLKVTLNDDKVFDRQTLQEIEDDLEKLEYPDVFEIENSMSDEFLEEHLPGIYLEDDLYDRLINRVVDWDLYYKEAIPHEKDEKLTC
ncbi:hypothetical protein AVL50_20280 [Flammeovirga sp. SJP92]|nr:hypothetical protein AVL50_20280 [Flammeovirga sp. SJP92]